MWPSFLLLTDIPARTLQNNKVSKANNILLALLTLLSVKVVVYKMDIKSKTKLKKVYFERLIKISNDH